MNVKELELKGLLLVELKVYGDSRGFFVERYNEAEFKRLGLPTHFVQDNHSRSAPNVVRGLHYQFEPFQQKLVGVTNGSIWDVVVDIRPDSPTFMKYMGVELSAENGRLLYIPKGFAHGFCVLGTQPADVLYKVDALYNPKGEAGLLWNDPELNIPWPIKNPVVSERDQKLSTAKQYRLSVGK